MIDPAYQEYELFQKHHRGYDELQSTLAEVVRKYVQEIDMGWIKVLEIGCGSGYTTKKLLDADKRILIDGLDIDEEMLSMAREFLKIYSVSDEDRIRLHHEDILSFFEHKSIPRYSVVASAYTLHSFLPDYRNLVFEVIYYALWPGGLFVNADKTAHDDVETHRQQIADLLTEYAESFVPIGRIDVLRRWIKHGITDYEEHRTMYEGRTKEYLSDVGFVDVKTVCRINADAVITAVKPGS